MLPPASVAAPGNGTLLLASTNSTLWGSKFSEACMNPLNFTIAEDSTSFALIASDTTFCGDSEPYVLSMLGKRLCLISLLSLTSGHEILMLPHKPALARKNAESNESCRLSSSVQR